MDIAGESATFYPSVGMNMMISGDVRVSLKSQGSDIISSMSATDKRTYYIFNDGLSNVMMNGSGTLDLFIAPIDYTDMMAIATFPALSSTTTTTLHYYDSDMSMYAPHAANPVTVQACVSTADCTNLLNWTSADNSAGSGHWSVPFPSGSGLVSSQTNTLYVRLLVGKDGVDEELKTSNGKVYDGTTNGYQTIATKPGSM